MAHQSFPCARAHSLFIGQIWAKTCLYKIPCSSSETTVTPNFFSMNLFSINCSCNSMQDLTSKYIVTSSKWRLNFKFHFFKNYVTFFMQIRRLLREYWSFCAQLSICCSWGNSLQDQSPRFFILTTLTWWILTIYIGMSISTVLRAISMRNGLWGIIDSALLFYFCKSSLILGQNSSSLKYVVP